MRHVLVGITAAVLLCAPGAHAQDSPTATPPATPDATDTPTPDPTPDPTPAPDSPGATPAPEVSGPVVDPDWRWTSRSNGMSDPRVSAIAVHPTDEGIAFAGTSDGAIYRTRNGGRRWFEVLRIFVSRRERVGRGLRRTGDDSDDDAEDEETETGQALEDELEQVFEDERERVFEELRELIGDNEAERIAEEEAERARERRRDELESGGAEDADAEEAALTSAAISEIAFHPDVPGVVFAATGDGLWRSQDDGRTWSHVLEGLGDTEAEGTTIVASLAASATEDGGRSAWVLSGTRGGLMRSADAGDSWSRASGRVGTAEIRRLAVHPDERHRIAVATDRGVFVSLDGSDSWSHVYQGLGRSGDVLSVAFDPAANGSLYIGTLDGLFRLDAGETSARRLDAGGFSRPVFRWILPVTPGELVVATPRGVHLSQDRGDSFEEMRRGLVTPSVSQVARAPGTPTVIWAASDLGVYQWRPGRRAGATPPRVPFAALLHSAHRYAYQDVDTLRRWRRHSRATAWLPRLVVSAGREYNFARSEEIFPVAIGPDAFVYDRRLTGLQDGSREFVLVQLVWRFDATLSSPVHLQAQTQWRRQARNRSDRSERVVRLARELGELRYQEPDTSAPPDDLMNDTLRVLARMEIEAYLDAVTGGVITEEKEGRE